MNANDKLAELINQAIGTYATMPLVNGCRPELKYFLADYLLANGVIVPPFKVGDTVYWYNMGGELTEAEVKMISVSVRHSKGYEYNVRFEDFGKTVFHSRKLAEEALNEKTKT